MSTSATKETSSPKVRPISTPRDPNFEDLASPLDSYLVDKKRRRGSSRVTDDELMKEMQEKPTHEEESNA